MAPKYSGATFFANSGIDTFIDNAHAIADNKIMIIGGKTLITGSFNFNKAAETKNAENPLVIQSPKLAKLYTENWKHQREHSEPYTPRD